ncbi:hypothetical protein PMAA_099240 [Talaromyces marneffei ATCC 18224]|uniref:Uncharacterized protein n=1 Tax=Talaromyces marneffei (strain ATCC 18224 / CBS 334.59 / QM 7333) TaxID=441960 RepID=B6QIZ0_TALMQ|nr:hypothetical protein PMAA_099240 [Talaromyces marneffei ATCC 18224]
MTTTSYTMTETTSTIDAATAYLDEEIDSSGEGDLTYEIGTIFKSLFATDRCITPRDAAHQIDAVYSDIWFPMDPTFRFRPDKGMPGYLGTLNEFIFTLARLLRYDDIRQDTLFLLILEILELPPRAAQIWDEDCKLYKHNPMFNLNMDDDWNMNSIPDSMLDEDDTTSASDIQEKCDDYMNYSAFLARCTGAGLYKNKTTDSGYKYCTYGIDDGLEKDMPQGIIRKSRILVAANYVLLSGRPVRDFCYSYPSDSDRGKMERDMWNSWKERFKVVADSQDEDPEIKEVTRKAHKIMVDY